MMGGGVRPPILLTGIRRVAVSSVGLTSGLTLWHVGVGAVFLWVNVQAVGDLSPSVPQGSLWVVGGERRGEEERGGSGIQLVQLMSFWMGH